MEQKQKVIKEYFSKNLFHILKMKTVVSEIKNEINSAKESIHELEDLPIIQLK